MNWMVDQLIQLAGSALILVAFVGAQTGRLDQKSRLYLLANALGSTALAVEAAYYSQWGFLLLEGAWAIISVLGIMSAGKGLDWSGSADRHVPGEGVSPDHSWPAGMRESIGDLPGSQTTDYEDHSQIAQEPLPRVQRGIETGDVMLSSAESIRPADRQSETSRTTGISATIGTTGPPRCWPGGPA